MFACVWTCTRIVLSRTPALSHTRRHPLSFCCMWLCRLSAQAIFSNVCVRVCLPIHKPASCTCLYAPEYACMRIRARNANGRVRVTDVWGSRVRTATCKCTCAMCAYVLKRVYVCVHVRTYVCVCMYALMSICVCIYIIMYVFMCVRVYVWMPVCLYSCMRISVRESVCVFLRTW